MIVVGGYDSSNTRNLTRVGAGRFPSYHVTAPTASAPRRSCTATRRATASCARATGLPPGEIAIGFTAGASTPDTLLGATVRTVLACAGAPLPEPVGHAPADRRPSARERRHARMMPGLLLLLQDLDKGVLPQLSPEQLLPFAGDEPERAREYVSAAIEIALLTWVFLPVPALPPRQGPGSRLFKGLLSC